uniref:Cytochrome P450-4d1 n=1 Tax=Glossina morsitans morsitans TaxID=37546 RepID=D3TN72_GLOMM
MDIFIALLFILTVLTVRFLSKWYKIFLIGLKIPGPLVLPMVGNIQMVSKLKPENLLLSLRNFREIYDQTYRLWLGPELWVFLHTPQETRDVLNNKNLSRPQAFQYLNALIGNGLLISEGNHWAMHRRILEPAFNINILNTFSESISSHSDIFINKIRAHGEKCLDVTDYLLPCIMDTIIHTSMGRNLQIQLNENEAYTQAFHRSNELLFQRMTNPLLFPDIIYRLTPMYSELKKSLKIIHKLMSDIVQERKNYLATKEHATAGKMGKTFLDTLLTPTNSGKVFSFQDIRDEVNTFVLAGVDTTTSAMCYVLYALAKYPQEQQKLSEEIQHIQQGCKLSANVGFSELQKYKYLDLFVKECLRFYTVVPLTGRQTTSSTRIGGRVYPAGVTVWINLYGLAHDPHLFENPDQFRPLRFAEEKSLIAFSYLPFSGGPHICIGRKYALMIMKIMTIKILEQFQLVLVDPLEDLILMAEMVLKSKNGINLIFKERENSSIIN